MASGGSNCTTSGEPKITLSKEDMKMQVVKNGEKIEMTYDEVCYDLGFCPAVQFVDITPRGRLHLRPADPRKSGRSIRR